MVSCRRSVTPSSDLIMEPAGISSYDISLEKQEVVVKGTIGYDTLLEKIKKTGKEVSWVSKFQHNYSSKH